MCECVNVYECVYVVAGYVCVFYCGVCCVSVCVLSLGACGDASNLVERTFPFCFYVGPRDPTQATSLVKQAELCYSPSEFRADLLIYF